MKTIFHKKILPWATILMLTSVLLLVIYNYKLENNIEIQNVKSKVWLTAVINFSCVVWLFFRKVLIDLEIRYHGEQMEAEIVENKSSAIIGIGKNAGINIFGYRNVYVSFPTNKGEKRLKLDGVYGKFPYDVGDRLTVYYHFQHPNNVVSENSKHLIYSCIFPMGWCLFVSLIFDIQTLALLY